MPVFPDVFPLSVMLSLIPQSESQPHIRFYPLKSWFKCCRVCEACLANLLARKMLPHVWSHTPLSCLASLDE